VTAIELATGVWRIPTAPYDLVSSYLLTTPDGALTLVDAGLKNAHKKVLAALAGLGRAPQDVTRILMTHAHSDHAGGLARAQQATGAQVVAHEREAVYLRDGRPAATDPSRWQGRLLGRMPGRGFAKVEVGSTFMDGTVLDGGVRVVHTPGHSPGHCSFLHEPTGVLITGDALFNVRGLRYSPKTFCTDVRQSRATAQVLGELEYETAAFTHGAHVSQGAREAVRAFLAGRPS
jgi:glyoxylase-like metal-dependent hydrolase (beta-lactamase superfamily II)